MTLQKLIDKVPSFTCKEGCSDCCGLVLFSHEEFKKIHGERIKQPAEGDCHYLRGHTCSIYANRPFMCRVFGITDNKDHLMCCPHGCHPDPPWSAEETEKLLIDYRTHTFEMLLYSTMLDTEITIRQNGEVLKVIKAN